VQWLFLCASASHGKCDLKPVLQALILAEHVYEDKSGKKIIAGTFNGLELRSRSPVRTRIMPDGKEQRLIEGGAHAGSPYAYISVTDVCDDTKLLLQFVDLSRNRVLFQTELAIRCEDRLGTVEIVAPLPPLIVPEEGVYAFEVVCEDEIIGSHRIVARREEADAQA
jgi:hypothetical protein